jgi:hypothetical protein
MGCYAVDVCVGSWRRKPPRPGLRFYPFGRLMLLPDLLLIRWISCTSASLAPKDRSASRVQGNGSPDHAIRCLLLLSTIVL